MESISGCLLISAIQCMVFKVFKRKCGLIWARSFSVWVLVLTWFLTDDFLDHLLDLALEL